MMTKHVRILRAVALCVVPVWFVLLFRYGMVPDQHQTLFLAAGTGLFAALGAFFATLAYGPLSFPRGSREALLSKALLAFIAVGLLVVVSGLARRLLG
jgi:RsiW-degrading membrane proteinase PrsW (M82 family)